MPTDADWMCTEDEPILGHLETTRLSYASVAAHEIGVSERTVETRLRALAEKGLVEPISGEIVYRLTQRGERHLTAIEEGGTTSGTNRALGD